jgi:hypothetical protein
MRLKTLQLNGSLSEQLVFVATSPGTKVPARYIQNAALIEQADDKPRLQSGAKTVECTHMSARRHITDRSDRPSCPAGHPVSSLSTPGPTPPKKIAPTAHPDDMAALILHHTLNRPR